MTDEYERHPKIVAATKGGFAEYWACTYIREEAAEAVQAELAPGWTAKLTERRLPVDIALALKMCRRSVQKLAPRTKFLL
jgi:hypothetical protein